MRHKTALSGLRVKPPTLRELLTQRFESHEQKISNLGDLVLCYPVNLHCETIFSQEAIIL